MDSIAICAILLCSDAYGRCVCLNIYGTYCLVQNYVWHVISTVLQQTAYVSIAKLEACWFVGLHKTNSYVCPTPQNAPSIQGLRLLRAI